MNASAAFQVDSGKVFKVDSDIVLVIVEDKLSYMPRVGDNAMPFNILELIESDEPSARHSLCQRTGGIIPKAVYNKLMADVSASKAQAEPSAKSERAPQAKSAPKKKATRKSAKKESK